MKRQRRTMKRGDVYEIEEKIGSGDWEPVCESPDLDEIKRILKTMDALEGEDDSA